MRIAMVSEHASPLAVLGGVDAGGQNVHVAALATALARLGADVRVFTRRDDPGLAREVDLRPGVRIVHLDAGPPWPVPKDELLPHMDALAAELRLELAGEPADVVHSHFWMSAYAALRALDGTGVPLVHTFHALGVVKRRYQGDKDTSPPERCDLERDVARRADRIVATCTDEVFELLRLGADNHRLAVIPCGVDLALFRPDGPSEPRTPGRRRLLCVGRLVERKGIGNVVSALAELPDTELVVAGGPARAELTDDPEAVRLRALAREHGVSDRVELRGRIEHAALPRLVRSADAVVCVPWYEPFGIVPLEAMACGVPVVASAVGGLIDTIVDGVTGIHVPPRDPERLAAALAPLLGDEPRRRAYGRAGIERARRLYAWDRIAAATHDVYAAVARERTAARRRRRAASVPGVRDHLGALRTALGRLEGEAERLDAWGRRIAAMHRDGHRLLALGNGGSAAEAQHLTAELVGRYRGERVPLSAICLHGDTSSLTAIANDYGAEEMFARQVRAHGRPGDVLLALSTSGASANVLAAVEAARACRMATWALTGEAPNPLADLADEAVCVPASETPTVQELHLVAVHLLCEAVERRLGAAEGVEEVTAWRPVS